MTLRLCTYNIRFILDRYPERKNFLKEVIIGVDADVYCMQEVLVGGESFGQQKFLQLCLNERHRQSKLKRVYRHYDNCGFRLYCDALPFGLHYIFNNHMASCFYDLCALFNEYYLSSILGKHIQYIYNGVILRVLAFLVLGTAWVFGGSILVNTAKIDGEIVMRHELLRIGGWRGVQHVLISIGNKVVSIVNVHLSSSADQEYTRVEEAKLICEWISNIASDRVIIAGDFNSTPNGPCYSHFLKHGFKSSFVKSCGSEPDKTFHQNHSCITKDIDEEATLDYIFYRGKLELNESLVEGGVHMPAVSLIGQNAHPGDSTLYASDHFGIVANFVLTD